MANRESLYHKHPDYRVDLDPNPKRVLVTLDGVTVADSERTLVVR